MRIDSYESEKHQEYVRRFLNGRFENSVFCLLAPDGQEWLTSANRGPEMVLGRRSSTERLKQFAFWYPATADSKEAIVQDFHSFRQALNVASADQRVLVLVNTTSADEQALRQSLRSVANDPRIVGRFHFDFEQGDAWKKSIDGTKDAPGIILINPGEFGMSGKVIKQLPLDADTSQIITALTQANAQFATTTMKKVYSEHVARGRRLGVYFEGAVPYGEDRDGDGQIDRGRSGAGRSGAGRSGAGRSGAGRSGAGRNGPGSNGPGSNGPGRGGGFRGGPPRRGGALGPRRSISVDDHEDR